jgi:hypothetical protein
MTCAPRDHLIINPNLEHILIDGVVRRRARS